MTAYQVTSTETVQCPECKAQSAVWKVYSGSITTYDPWEREYINEPLSDGFSIECNACDFVDGEPPQY